MISRRQFLKASARVAVGAAAVAVVGLQTLPAAVEPKAVVHAGEPLVIDGPFVDQFVKGRTVSLSDGASVHNCTFDSCAVSVAGNARVTITNTRIISAPIKVAA